MAEVSERVEAVARALCEADGKNPTEARARKAGFQRFAGEPAEKTPQLWESYIAEAERFVVAIETMQPFLERARRW